MKLKDKVVVVTGSSRGIGKAIALSCALLGAKVVLSSRRDPAVQDAVREFKGKGLTASGIAANVSKNEDVEKLFAHSIAAFGRIDVWINNAGIASGFRTIQSHRPEEIKEVIDTNLYGTLNACRIVIPYFIEQGGGTILNLSGWGGRHEAAPYVTTYAATKSATVSLTKSLAKENRRHAISINAVQPGMVVTDIFKDVRTSPETKDLVKYLPIVLKSLAVKPEDAGRFVASVAAKKPGRSTGKVYFLGGKRRYVRGLVLLLFYFLKEKMSGLFTRGK